MNLFEIETWVSTGEKTQRREVGLVIADHMKEVLEHLKLDLEDTKTEIKSIKDHGPIYADLRKNK